MRMIASNRRLSRRYGLRLALRYRLSEKGVEHRWCSGMTRDMSRDGVLFRTRRPLPIGSHIEIRVDWPARYESVHPVDLQITGFVVRSEHGRTAVRINSHRFLVDLAHGPAALSKTA